MLKPRQWFTSRDFIVNIRLSNLSLTASLKAAQLSATILVYDSQARAVATRILIQSALQRYNNGTLDQNFVSIVTVRGTLTDPVLYHRKQH